MLRDIFRQLLGHPHSVFAVKAEPIEHIAKLLPNLRRQPLYRPEEAAQAYKDRIENMDETLGAVFDWTV